MTPADCPTSLPAARRTGAAAWEWEGLACAGAQENMDRDRRIFDEVKRGLRGPTVRFYRWAGPALSYGRTQGIDSKSEAEARLRGFAVVRRPTGGGKVWHQNDLCFSVAWSRDNAAIPWKVKDSYGSIHRWVQQSLERLGFHHEMAGKKDEAQGGWCFQAPVCFDLMSQGQKTVGGAQWRDGAAALHQGSIQLNLSGGALRIFKESFESCFGAAFPSCSSSS